MELLETNTFGVLVDEDFYLTNNIDVQAAVESGQFSSATEHFSLYGRYELRQPISGFDYAYYLSDLPDSTTASERSEMILALESDDMVIGMGGDDFVNGNLGDDILNGNLGNDTLRGGQGNDIAWGGEENDFVFGDKDSDTLWGNLGNDEVLGGIDDDFLFGNIGNDTLNGNQGEDTLYGGQDDDLVRGGQDNDWLFGDKGNDTLFGDKGADTLTGGSGSDRFAIGSGTGGPNVSDADYIMDFTIGQDFIQLTDGLTFQQLNILAGTEEYEGHAIIQNAVTGEYLAIVREVDISAIASADNFLAETAVTQAPRNRSNLSPQNREPIDSTDSTNNSASNNNFDNLDSAIGIGTDSIDNSSNTNNTASTNNAGDSIDNRNFPELVSNNITTNNRDNNTGATDSAGNTGNPDNTGNTGATDSAGNIGNTDTAGNTGNTDTAGNTGNTDTAGNTGNSATTAINNAPTVTSLIRTGTENTDIAFSATDFTSQFSDIDGDRLAKIQITALPGNGTLKLSGTAVNLNQEINLGDLGNLNFTPDANFNGNASFDWTGHDGTEYAATAAKVILNINPGNPGNNAPTIADLNQSNNQNTEIAFNVADFTSAFSDVDGDSLAKIKVTSLPTFGMLKLGGVSVTANQEIDVADLNNLSFTPLVNFNGSTSFGWNGFDGTTYAAVDGTVNIDAQPAGSTQAAAWDIGTLEGNRPFNDAVGATDPEDYYKFALSSKSNFRVAIDNLTANADIELLDSSGNVLESSAQGGTVADVIATPLDAGSYYVRVSGNSDTDYNLVVSSQSITTTGNAYYVSADGNNLGAGTFDDPFKTIQKAADIAQAGDAVYIRGATYREKVIPQNSGTAGAPITFTAYANEEVTTSGTELISGWTQNNREIYKANMGWDLGEGSNQIFVNGEMMVEARWPNIPDSKSLASISRNELAISDTGGIDNPNAPAGSIARGNYTDSDLDNANFADDFWVGAKINTIPGWIWTPKTGTVVSNSNGSIEFDFPYGGSVEYLPRELNPYYLWGKYEALDTAKEWYYDNGELFLWSPNSDDPSNYTVEAKRREWAWEIIQKDYINLENINVFGAGIKVWRSNNVILDEIDSQYGAHKTLFDDTGADKIWENGETGQPGQTTSKSIAITDGSNNLITNSRIAYSSGNGIFMRGTSHQITNSVIHDIGYSGVVAGAIDLYGQGHEVTNNTFFGSGSRLINLHVNGASKILNNELYDAGKIAVDFGAITAFESDGGGSQIAYNSIHDIQALADKSNQYWGSTGITLEKSKGYDVENNVIYNTSIEGFKFYNSTLLGGPNINLRNNTIDGEILFNARGGTLDGSTVENNISSGNAYVLNTSDVVDVNNLETSDFSSIFADPTNRDYQLKTNISQGAIAFGQEPWTPGAVLSGDDFYSLDIQASAPQNGKISGQLVGLDVGNKLPEDFQLIIGNAPASGKFSSTYFDPNTDLATVTFTDVEVGDAKGVQPIFVQIGNNTPIYLGKTINLG
ncbi:MAG: hypothetical protein F6J93_00790 [Oscillatoria sp. SIO1A7]|nr:hypothetical protein [Oscillatoria sp. SIO1A7]